MNVQRRKILLSVDVEEWFQAESLSQSIYRGSWNEQRFRVEQNIDLILGILNEFEVKATFFCLGWIAERIPKLISSIADHGHEIASHGYSHRLIYEQTPTEFQEDITKTKKLLEDIVAREVNGYRAPTFSITDWAFPIIRGAGYTYDSSVVITDVHDRYGSVFSSAGKEPGDFFEIYPSLYEFSLPCLKILGKSIPWSGGGFFRLFPLNAYLAGLEKILSSKDCIFYFSSWEIDPEQPKVGGISVLNQFRQYINLDKTSLRLYELLQAYGRECITFGDYLGQLRPAEKVC